MVFSRFVANVLTGFLVVDSRIRLDFFSGILDPDDLLCDVADDKDQLIAIYEEEGQHQRLDSSRS